jgi:hypothetical protein
VSRRRSPILALLLAACAAQRSLTLTSTPPGAEVALDGELLGLTPRTVEFFDYGVRSVTFRMEGYLTHVERLELEPPWYARFPMDLVSELLVPWGWKDERSLAVVLEPGEDEVHLPSLMSVLERADELRRAGPEGPRGERPRPLRSAASRSERP